MSQAHTTRRVVIDHLTIAVGDLERSRAFYARALEPLGFTAQGSWSGAAREIAPGPRPEYSEGCYGAFVLDPDGHNIEAVCHRGASVGVGSGGRG